ncbi:hypothetical protein [Neptuniibacter sp.]|uniref:hypothetical protein n=1 Tax=Neptuniibacter sp. TaxID=1962643 RepID=UPI002618E3A2|nr:hypothetical protein [Neptuniibacter sp.]MCP4595036.1 hypothetical protein [Neptuniibacter sp.]
MRNHKFRHSASFFLIPFLFLAGCQTSPQHAQGDEGPLFRRGVISTDGVQLTFKPCYVRKTESITDHSGRLATRFKRTGEPSVYAEMSGDRIVPGEPWQVYSVHLMGGNQFTCHYELQGNEYRAAGDRPVWVADVREETINVQIYDQLSHLVFPRGEPVNLGNGLEWDSTIRAEGLRRSLNLKLLRQPCRDRYGIDYEYSAEMSVLGRSFTGCAREGNLDLRTLPGLYSSELSETADISRFISMDLTSEYEVILTQDYRNDQPLIVQKGTWKRLSSDKIIVHLTEIDGRNENEVMVFKRNKAGGLVLQGFSPTYGHDGLRFERAGPDRTFRK